MRKGLFLFLFLPISLYFASASNPYLDSLIHEAETNPNDSLRYHALNKLATAYIDSAFDKSIKYWQEALTLSKLKNNKYWTGEIHRQLGFMYHRKGESAEALEEYNKSLQYFDALKDYVRQGEIHNDVGIIYKTWGKYDKALEYYITAMSLFEKTGYKEGSAMTANSIGQIYFHQEDYPKAIEFFTDYLNFNQKNNFHRAIAGAYNNIASAYMEMNNLDLALDYYSKALSLYDSLNVKFGVAILNDNIGELYTRKEKYTDALSYHFRSLYLLEKLNSTARISYVKNNIGFVFYKQKKYLKAIDYLTESKVIATELNQIDVLKEIYYNLSMVFEASKNYEKSLDAHRMYTQIKDSLQGLETKEKLSKIEFQYALDAKSRELEMAKTKHAQKRSMISILGYLGLAFVIITLLLGKNSFRKKGNLALYHKQNQQFNESINSIFKNLNSHLLGLDKLFSEYTLIPESTETPLPLFILALAKRNISAFIEVNHKISPDSINVVKLLCLEVLNDLLEQEQAQPISPSILGDAIISKVNEKCLHGLKDINKLTVNSFIFDSFQKRIYCSGHSVLWHANLKKSTVEMVAVNNHKNRECFFDVNEGDILYYLAIPQTAQHDRNDNLGLISLFEKTFKKIFSSPLEDQKVIIQSTVDFWNSSYKLESKFLMFIFKI